MNMNGMMPNFYMGNGMVPNPNVYQQPKTLNWLPNEDYALLQKGLSQFSLSVTKEELAKGQCNHYDKNAGNTTLIPDPDGSGGCTCTICGTHFYSKDFTKEEIEAAVANILDILNTIKIMYLSIDPSAALEYFQIIPFIEKIPALYNIAVQDFKKYEGVDSFIPNNASMNPFNVYAMMMNNPGFGMGMVPQQQMNMASQMMPQQGYGFQPQQQMGMPQQTPQQQMNMAQQGYGFQPNMNAGFAQQNPQFNPMYGMTVPAGGYQPQQQGFSMNPTGAATPQQQGGYVGTNMPNAMNPTGVAPVAQTNDTDKK